MSGWCAQQLPALGRRVRRDQLDALAVERVIVEREARAVVDGGIVVDDRHLPARRRRDGLLPRLVVDQGDDVGFVAHATVPKAGAGCIGSASSGAIRGRTMRKLVPSPGADARLMRPPKRRVTRL